MLAGVVFDAYGTIFDAHAIRALAERLAPGKGAALSVLWRDRQLDYARLRTLAGQYADFWSITRDALDYAADTVCPELAPAARRQLMASYASLAAFPDVAPALAALRAQGVQLAILSNANPPMLDAALREAGLAGAFGHLLSADTVRRYKTAPEAYALGPDAFGKPAANLLFVSSNGWDVCGAAWFGYRTFWVNRAAAPPERLGITPNGEGRTLSDLVEFCKRDETNTMFR